MYQIGRNVYASFNEKNIGKTVEQKVRSVITGHCGNGKTNLINNLCNTTHKSFYSGESEGDGASMTRDIAYEDVAYFNPTQFRIYDTPGSNSNQDAFGHALVLRASLTSLPLNLIMINSKLSTRFSENLKQFKEQIRIFKGYQHLVVFLVSHLDSLDNQKNKKEVIENIGKSIQKYNKQFLKQLKVIIYSNKNSNFENLANILFSMGKSNKKQLVKIDDEKFYKYFNISRSIRDPDSLKSEEYIQQIMDQCQIFIRHIKNLPNDKTQNNMQDISNLKLFMKAHLKQVQHRQYKQYYQNFKDDFKSTNLFLMLSQYIQSKLQQFQELAQPKYQKKYYDSSRQMMINILDLIKECPHCGLIWMKTIGCHDTYCGQKSIFKDVLHLKQVYNYKFEIKQGKILFQKDRHYMKERESLQHQTQVAYLKRSGNGQRPQNTIGCGKRIQWDKIPRSQKVKTKLKQIFNVSNYEQIKLQQVWLQNENKKFHQQNNQKLEKSKLLMEKDKSETQ